MRFLARNQPARALVVRNWRTWRANGFTLAGSTTDPIIARIIVIDRLILANHLHHHHHHKKHTLLFVPTIKKNHTKAWLIGAVEEEVCSPRSTNLYIILLYTTTRTSKSKSMRQNRRANLRVPTIAWTFERNKTNGERDLQRRTR